MKTSLLLPILLLLAACAGGLPETKCVEQSSTLAQSDACRAAVRAAASDGGVK